MAYNLGRQLSSLVFSFSDFGRLLALVVALAFSNAGSAFSSPYPADLCETSARTASAQSGVPLSVLRAISLTETGRKKNGKFKPWPWTVNMEGKGVWFDSANEAKAYAIKNYKRGARSFDVGCFQLNYRWHGKAFTSIEQMFEPDANAAYAAKYLLELHSEFGNWTDAAGAYHSRTPKFANKYKKRFTSIRNNLPDDLPATTQLAQAEAPAKLPTPNAPRINKFPLLTSYSSRAGSLGSLVPSAAGQNLPRLIVSGD